MAKQSGIIKLEGTIGDITFYKSQDGLLARAKGGVDANRIQNDAAFQRTRENGEEFGRAGAAGKLLRLAFRNFLQKGSDSKMVSRLTKEMMAVIKADETNTRGQRNVLDGELELLEGFDFNIDGKLSSTIFFSYTTTMDRPSGTLTIDIPAFSPANAIAYPDGATHVKLVSGGAAINFEAGTFESVMTQSGDIVIGEEPVEAIQLLNQLDENGVNPIFLTLGVEFYQRVNNQNYSLKNGRYNALAIIRVLGA